MLPTPLEQAFLAAKQPGARPFGIMFVCMGNICRSPTAEGVFRAKSQKAGISPWLRIDSAGTHNYHPRSPPDERSQAHALKRGYDLSQLRARQIQPTDFAEFGLILAMDWDNLALTQAEFESLPSKARCYRPPQIRRLTEFCKRADAPIVPDPYDGGAHGFELVLDLVEDAADGLITQLLR